VLGVLITLDELVESQNLMREHWTLYKRSVSSVVLLTIISVVIIMDKLC